jgi:hypothetical protein
MGWFLPAAFIVLVEETQMANRATDWTRLRVSVVVGLTAG